MSKPILIENNIKEKLINLYLEQNLSKSECCNILNLTNHTLSKLLKELNIKKTSEQITELRKKTNIQKWGVDNPSKCLDIKNKISQKNHLNKESRIQKQKETKKEKYGDENFNNIEKNKLTKKIKYNNQNYNNRNKYKNTMLKNYGVDNSFKLLSTIDTNKKNIFLKLEYTELFKSLFDNRNKAIDFLRENNYSYFDLSKLFNAPYYTVQAWATKLEVKDLIKHTFEGKSNYETEIIAFLSSLEIVNIIRNSKDYLDGQEIDIYLPDYKIGIEFNGTFWHSDLYKNINYHYAKSLLAESKGIRLIHIYQYEWDDLTTREKIKSLLRIALHKQVNKIYARQCDIKVISDNEAKELNNKVHLQNHRHAHITYGLFYNNELVQLMSFSKNKKYQWEIIRGCPGSNNIVIGGVSKLFKHFIRDYNPNEVFSYCDFNKFDGKSYEALGMKFIGYTGPDMKYIIKGNVINRQPSKYKEIKSQIEARIYGAGSKKYLWKRDTHE